MSYCYTTILIDDVFGDVRRVCVPDGKEWFRKSQIDKLLDEDHVIPMRAIQSQLVELGLVA